MQHLFVARADKLKALSGQRGEPFSYPIKSRDTTDLGNVRPLLAHHLRLQLLVRHYSNLLTVPDPIVHPIVRVKHIELAVILRCRQHLLVRGIIGKTLVIFLAVNFDVPNMDFSCEHIAGANHNLARVILSHGEQLSDN